METPIYDQVVIDLGWDPLVPECNCESMSGRFGAHRPECPWQIAFEQQVRRAT